MAKELDRGHRAQGGAGLRTLAVSPESTRSVTLPAALTRAAGLQRGSMPPAQWGVTRPHAPEACSPPATTTGATSLSSPRGTSLSQARNCDSGASSRAETFPVPDFLSCTMSPAGVWQGQRHVAWAHRGAAGEQNCDPGWVRSHDPPSPQLGEHGPRSRAPGPPPALQRGPVHPPARRPPGCAAAAARTPCCGRAPSAASSPWPGRSPPSPPRSASPPRTCPGARRPEAQQRGLPFQMGTSLRKGKDNRRGDA